MLEFVLLFVFLFKKSKYLTKKQVLRISLEYHILRSDGLEAGDMLPSVNDRLQTMRVRFALKDMNLSDWNLDQSYFSEPP